jgi:Protein of unknown function (DUF3421)
VPVGTTADGSYAFIGRVTLNGCGTLVGTIYPQLGRIFFNRDSQEGNKTTYQVLCHPSEVNCQSLTRIPQCEATTDHYQWVSVKLKDKIPSYAVEGGCDSNNKDLYVARFWIDGEVIVGKIIGSSGAVSLVDFISGPHRNKEIKVKKCQILTGTGFRWEASENADLPNGAVQTGETENGEPIFVGRGTVKDCLTPGKVVPSKDCVFIGSVGCFCRVHCYEMLIHDHRNG